MMRELKHVVLSAAISFLSAASASTLHFNVAPPGRCGKISPMKPNFAAKHIICNV